MSEDGDELGTAKLRQIRCRTCPGLFRNDAPDPSQSSWIHEVVVLDVLFQVGTEGDAVLDDAPVKIDDVKRSIGSRGHADRTEALIRGAVAEEQYIERSERSTPGAHEGGKATADAFARREFDDLNRGYFNRHEPDAMPVKEWIGKFGSKSSVYRRIARIRKEYEPK